MHNHRKSLLVAIVGLSTMLCFSTTLKADAVYTEQKGLAKDIADAYIKSFPSEVIVRKPPSTRRKAWNVRNIRPPKLSDKVTREVVFNDIFSKSPRYELLQKKLQAVLNEYSWVDMNLFYGTTSTPGYHLMSRIKRTITTLGEGVLATMLVTPTSDINKLRKRQKIVKAFMKEDDPTVQGLRECLQTYQDAEQSFFSLWTPTDPLYTKEYVKYMNRYFYVKDNEAYNKSAGRLELKKRLWRDGWDISLNIISPVYWYGIPVELNMLVWGGQGFHEPSSITGRSPRAGLWRFCIPYVGPMLTWNSYTTVRDEAQKLEGVSQVTGVFNAVIATLLITEVARYSYGLYRSWKKYAEYSSALHSLALRMADVQAFVVAAAEVSDLVAASPELEKLYSSKLTKIRALLDQSKGDTELGDLVRYLQQLPYTSWSYFFSNAGKLLASHSLFTEYKDEFADAMYEMGQLDAFLSIATLVQESKNNDAAHQYVFAEYLSRKEQRKPYIKLEDMWNPFLDAKTAVGNSIVMDASDPKGVRNIILTGPNAGGKSTFLKGVTSCILLSQTLGVVPAAAIVLTPFDKINTYINISDDIAAGKSLFMAEVDRAQKHLDILQKLKPDQLSFSILDEVFSGTNPREGAAAVYSVLEAMADYSNTLNIVATHYPVVMLLEQKAQGKGFRNYKVYIKYNKNAAKKIQYTYKVIPGKSDQAIAIDILEEQGYNTRLLKRARHILEHPEEYQTSF